MLEQQLFLCVQSNRIQLETLTFYKEKLEEIQTSHRKILFYSFVKKLLDFKKYNTLYVPTFLLRHSNDNFNFNDYMFARRMLLYLNMNAHYSSSSPEDKSILESISKSKQFNNSFPDDLLCTLNLKNTGTYFSFRVMSCTAHFRNGTTLNSSRILCSMEISLQSPILKEPYLPLGIKASQLDDRQYDMHCTVDLKNKIPLNYMDCNKNAASAKCVHSDIGHKHVKDKPLDEVIKHFHKPADVYASITRTISESIGVPENSILESSVAAEHRISHACEERSSIKQVLFKFGVIYQAITFLLFSILKVVLPGLPWVISKTRHLGRRGNHLTNHTQEATGRLFSEDIQSEKNEAPPLLLRKGAVHLQQNLTESDPGSSEDFRRESYRLCTFAEMPTSVQINYSQFAAAGFYYTGRDTEVKCFACSRIIISPSAHVDPFLLRNHESSCRFARNTHDCGNIRVSGQPSPSSGPPSLGAPNAVQRSAGELLLGGTSTNVSFESGNAVSVTNINIARNRNEVAGTRNVAYHSARQPQPHPQQPPPSYTSVQAPVPVPVYDIPFQRQLATVIVPEHARLLQSSNLHQEDERLRTFARWPTSNAPPASEMARNGWFYLGNLDRTQCFSCGGVLRNWRITDNPRTEHMSHFPSCPMVLGRETRNVPDPNQAASSSSAPRSPPTITEQERNDLRVMFPCFHPVTPHMNQIASRLATYAAQWMYTRATPRMLAEAGLFSLGVRDRVKCFYCNGGLQNWRRNDDPWEEHAKWYPTCEFLLQQRGPEFIHRIVARFPDLDRPIMSQGGLDVPPPSLPSVQSGPERLPTPPPKIRDQPASVQETRSVLEEALDSEVAATVIGMGFEREIVQRVIQRNIDLNGVAFLSASALLDAVLQHQESPPASPMDETVPQLPYFRQQEEHQHQQNQHQNHPLENQHQNHQQQNQHQNHQQQSQHQNHQQQHQHQNHQLENQHQKHQQQNQHQNHHQNHQQQNQHQNHQQQPRFLARGLDEAEEDEDIYASHEPSYSGSQPTVPNRSLVDLEEPMSPSTTEASSMFFPSGFSEILVPHSSQPAYPPHPPPPYQPRTPTSLSQRSATPTGGNTNSGRFVAEQNNGMQEQLEQSSSGIGRLSSAPKPMAKEDLKRQLEELKDERRCKVCLDRQADVVFIPCGHICCCLECTAALRHCPVCRVKIDKAVRTYTQ